MTEMANIVARLQVLEDIEAIKQLKHRYFFYCDQKLPAKVLECFAEGPIHLDYGRVGIFTRREQLVEIFSRLACVEHIVEMHHAQNPIIKLVGPDFAQATWSLYYYMINTRENTVTQLGGYYEDDYRRIDGTWRIVRSIYQVTSTTLLDMAAGPVRAVFVGGKAPVELDNPASQA